LRTCFSAGSTFRFESNLIALNVMTSQAHYGDPPEKLHRDESRDFDNGLGFRPEALDGSCIGCAWI
jgi:hypothetical protein